MNESFRCGVSGRTIPARRDGGLGNDDGLVTGADLIEVQQNFGKVASPSPLPEPATLALLVLSGAFVQLRRRR